LFIGIFLQEVAMVTVNGELIPADGMTVSEYLAKENLHPAHVAVMINGEILPKSEYLTTVLENGFEAEIIGFVGGG
jgi:thiamine biosynthesis protein ThiS